MGKYLSKFLGGLLALPVLLFSGNLGHAAFSHSMSGMPSGMPSNQCQSSCTTSQTPANAATKPQDLLKDRTPEPQPAEPYYLAFIGAGWATVLAVSAAYLLRHLRWRPPDLFKLNVNYQF